MRKALKSVFLAVIFATCFIVSAKAAETIGLNDLINNAKTCDKQTVTVEGEAIGEVLERGDYAWVNINDGTNAIGIWMTKVDAKTIEKFGDYKNIGDTLQITGVFSRSCTEHGGDIDIHCATLEIIKGGYPVKNKIPDTKVITAAGLLFIAFAIAYVYFKVFRKVKS